MVKDKPIISAGLYGLYAALFCAKQGDRFCAERNVCICPAVPCIAFSYLACKGTDRRVYLYIFLIAAIVGSFYIQGFCQHLLPAGLVSDAMEISIGRTLQAVFLMAVGIALFTMPGRRRKYE